VRPGEQTWWAAELTGDGSADNPDSVYHQTSRFGGRYLRLKGHYDGNVMRYYGWLADNGAVPNKGTDNAGNATLDKIDAAVARQMKRAGVPGATLAVVKNGKLIHAKGYGFSSIGAGRVTEPTDTFRMASVTKTITGAAILRLIQDGTTLPSWLPGAGAPVTLDTRPFGQIWAYTPPNRTPNLGQITFRHLLEHSTGLHGSFEFDVAPADWIARETSMGAASFRYAPGQKGPAGDQFYKNTHYYMLGAAVSAIRFQLFDDYVQSTFFEPLSIERVRVSHATGAPDEPGLFQARNYERPGRFARSFRNPDGTIDATPADHAGDGVLTPFYRQPAGAYAASPIDLLRFATSLDGSKPGPRALDAEHFGWIQTQASPALAGTGRLLGWFGLPQHHNGYLPGVAHAHLRLLGNGVKYALMSNSDSMTNLALQTSNRRTFEGELVGELDAIFAAESHLLPVRDFFDQYVPPPCGSDFHGLPMASFQACYLGFGYKATHFVAYNNEAGQPRFAAIWRPVSGDWFLSRSSSGPATRRSTT
jgi:CubicO group peptidase (beta-lactamase class C family)